MGDGSIINCAAAAAASVSSVHKHHVQSLKQFNCLIPLDNNRCGWRLILFVLSLLLAILAQRQRALRKGGIQIPSQLRRYRDACHRHSAGNCVNLLLLLLLLLLLGAFTGKTTDAISQHVHTCAAGLLTYHLRLRQATIGTSTARMIIAASRPDKPATMVIMACGSPSEVTLVTVI